MNKIELLPKEIYYKDDVYHIRMWLTAFGCLCLGYCNPLDLKSSNVLFSVCVEPENHPHSIVEHDNGWMNEGIGNTVSLDDACEEILDYIEKNKENFKCY